MSQTAKGVAKGSLLDRLLSSQIDGRPLTTDEVSANVFTFLSAGSETTSTTIAFALYFLHLVRAAG